MREEVLDVAQALVYLVCLVVFWRLFKDQLRLARDLRMLIGMADRYQDALRRFLVQLSDRRADDGPPDTRIRPEHDGE